MSEIAVRIEGLGKKYVLSHQRDELYVTLRDVLTSGAKAFGRRILSPFSGSARPARRSLEEFWAIRDISFDVQAGEAIAIVGRNGAGKSTLLKILSRITAPTEGRIRIRGRVGSLLEVGTGFHQELSGRENIYLNGAILGMGQSEIRRKFDEIVAFAEMDKFLDTPVKRYSSGMYMRLAFAIAAHLEPEILVVDEVLAVGDLAFQAKCLGKMEGAMQGGRTVLFVSHNMSAVQRLCKTAILLEGGRVRMRAPSHEVIQSYLSSVLDLEGEKVWDAQSVGATPSIFRPIAVRVRNPQGKLAGQVFAREPFTIEFDYELTAPCQGMRVSVSMHTNQGDLLFTTGDLDDFQTYEKHWNRRPGRYRASCRMPANLFNEGRHYLSLGAEIPGDRRLFQEEHALSFRVDVTGGVGSHWPQETLAGLLRPSVQWDIECG